MQARGGSDYEKAQDEWQSLIFDSSCIADREVREAMSLAYDMRRIVLEPSGAVALAGLLQCIDQMVGRDIVVMATGGNIAAADFARLVS